MGYGYILYCKTFDVSRTVRDLGLPSVGLNDALEKLSLGTLRGQSCRAHPCCLANLSCSSISRSSVRRVHYLANASAWRNSTFGSLPPGWTLKHTGVRFRYEAVELENGTTLGRQVVLEAIHSAGLRLPDMELLVDSSLRLQQPIPTNSALLQEALGRDVAGCATMDIHASCMGFVAAL